MAGDIPQDFLVQLQELVTGLEAQVMELRRETIKEAMRQDMLISSLRASRNEAWQELHILLHKGDFADCSLGFCPTRRQGMEEGS